jgi:hypothetical protein
MEIVSKRQGLEVGPLQFALMGASFAALLFLPIHPAGAQERWLAQEDRAEAILPGPSGTDAVISATMICAEQRWSFRLAFDGEVEPRAGAAVLTVDRSAFETQADLSGGELVVDVPFEALEPLKRGLRLTVALEEATDSDAGEATFSLIGSRVAITAMEEICSRPDMSAYRQLTFTPYSSYMGLARQLRQDDMRQFRLATSSEPELTVAMGEFGDGRRVLFTKLCGSSWYFGRSGCNLTGFAPDHGQEGWRVVYDTEGVALHIDDTSDEYGWPDLVTLPLRASGEASTWRWQGSRYGLLAD